MYKLIIANKNYSSWSLRPWLLMRELGIAFEEETQLFQSNSNFELFSAFSPSGQVPCLVDGEVTVWDSLAIAEYLAERHEGVWPSDAKARAWARSAAAEMHSGFTALRGHCPMNVGIRVGLNGQPQPLVKDMKRLAALWTDGLKRFGGPFLAGAQFSAADAFFGPVAFRVRSYGLDLGPEANGYAERLLALPGMREWEKQALAEPWREAQHEAEAAEVGTIVGDARAAALS